jgi:2-keto-4-pentenoate hydratase/2-oxohepta-3-ene-1,7-dioic acid hydratase in catechol pathway
MPQPRVWLKPGDEVVVEVEGLGKLVTPLVGPAS